MATETIGEQITIAMRLRGLNSTRQLQELSGVEYRVIDRAINGITFPRESTLEAIARGLRCEWRKSYNPGGEPVWTLHVRRPGIRGN